MVWSTKRVFSFIASGDVSPWRTIPSGPWARSRGSPAPAPMEGGAGVGGCGEGRGSHRWDGGEAGRPGRRVGSWRVVYNGRGGSPGAEPASGTGAGAGAGSVGSLEPRRSRI